MTTDLLLEIVFVFVHDCTVLARAHLLCTFIRKVHLAVAVVAIARKLLQYFNSKYTWEGGKREQIT